MSPLTSASLSFIFLLSLPWLIVASTTITGFHYSITNGVFSCDQPSGSTTIQPTLTNCVNNGITGHMPIIYIHGPPSGLTFSGTGASNNFCASTITSTTVGGATYKCTLKAFAGTYSITASMTSTTSVTYTTAASPSITYIPAGSTSNTITVTEPGQWCDDQGNGDLTFNDCPFATIGADANVQLTVVFGTPNTVVSSSVVLSPIIFSSTNTGSDSLLCGTGSSQVSANTYQCALTLGGTGTSATTLYAITRDGYTVSYPAAGDGADGGVTYWSGSPVLSSVTCTGCTGCTGTTASTLALSCSSTAGGTLTFTGSNFGPPTVAEGGYTTYAATSLSLATLKTTTSNLDKVCGGPLTFTSDTSAYCSFNGLSLGSSVTVSMVGWNQYDTTNTVAFTYSSVPTITSMAITGASAGGCAVAATSSLAAVNCPITGLADSGTVALNVAFTGTGFTVGSNTFVFNLGSISGCQATSTTAATCSFYPVGVNAAAGSTYSSASGAANPLTVTAGGVAATFTGSYTITFAAVPTISSFSSNVCASGSSAALTGCNAAGGQYLTITGTSLYAPFSNYGSMCQNAPSTVSGSSGTALTCTLVAEGSSASVTGALTAAGGPATSTATFTYTAVTVSSVVFTAATTETWASCTGSPTFVNCPRTSSAGTFTINGGGFTGYSSSSFCGQTTSTSDTQIVCSLPAVSNSQITLSLVINGATVSFSSYTMTFAGVPTITAVSATTGVCDSVASTSTALASCSLSGSSGSNYVLITGTYLFGAVTSNICSGTAMSVSGSTGTQVECNLVAYQSTSPVTVTAKAGGVTATAANALTVAYAIPTVTGMTSSSTSVCTGSNTLVNCPTSAAVTSVSLTMTGSNLGGVSAANLCAGSFTSLTSGQIVCSLKSLSALGTSQSATTSLSLDNTYSFSGMTVSFAAAPSLTTIGGCATASTSSLQGCSATSSASVITLSGANFFSGATVSATSGATTVSPCASVTVSSGSIVCTLASGSQQIGVQLTNFQVTTAGGIATSSLAAAYTTNGVYTNPTLASTPALTATSISVTAAADVAGNAFVIVLAAGSTAPTAATITSTTSLCTIASITASASNLMTFTASGCSALGSTTLKSSVDVYVYFDSASASSPTPYGGISAKTTVSVCHSDCSTCSAPQSAASCTACPGSNYLFGTKCCDSSCTSCALASGGSYSAPSSCLTCAAAPSTLTTGKGFPAGVFLRKTAFNVLATSASTTGAGFSTQGLCCAPSCLTCSAAQDASQCTSCPGRDGGILNGGHCYGSHSGTSTEDYAEIHGDPHFVGFLHQQYSVSGVPDRVYNLITDREVQYNARIVWFGDVYRGVDETDNTPYVANVTYFGEAGFKFRSLTNDHEHRVHFGLKDGKGELSINGAVAHPTDEPIVLSEPNVHIIYRGDKVSISTYRFRWTLHVGGSGKKSYINQEVGVLEWEDIASHGLLGQSWKREPAVAHPRNAIWRNHTGDFQFKQADFLEGHLLDYTVNGDVYSDEFHYDLYAKH